MGAVLHALPVLPCSLLFPQSWRFSTLFPGFNNVLKFSSPSFSFSHFKLHNCFLSLMQPNHFTLFPQAVYKQWQWNSADPWMGSNGGSGLTNQYGAVRSFTGPGSLVFIQNLFTMSLGFSLAFQIHAGSWIGQRCECVWIVPRNELASY